MLKKCFQTENRHFKESRLPEQETKCTEISQEVIIFKLTADGD